MKTRPLNATADTALRPLIFPVLKLSCAFSENGYICDKRRTNLLSFIDADLLAEKTCPRQTGWQRKIKNTLMKTFRAWWGICSLFFLSPNGFAQFTYVTNCCPDTITITGYTGAGDAVVIPNSITGLPVTSVGEEAFLFTGLTSVDIPLTVTSIGDYAFYACSNLTGITIPNSVASIGDGVFTYCYSMTNVAVGNGVTNIGDEAFEYCSGLASVFFNGNAPSADSTVFERDNATVYYLPGTTGWGSTYAGLPAVLWNPSIQNFGIQNNNFSFMITGTANIPIVVQSSANLASGGWTSLQSCTLTNGSISFSDSASANYQTRFYRISFPN
jgi:hypothetical protein